MKSPDLSESTWLGSAILVLGFLFGCVGVATLFVSDQSAIYGIAVGAGWTLCIVLLAFSGSLRKRIKILEKQLETTAIDLNEARRQAAEWSATSKAVSTSVQSVLELVGLPTATRAPRRRPKSEAPGEAN